MASGDYRGGYRAGYRDQGYISGYPGPGTVPPPPSPSLDGLVAWFKADAGVTKTGSDVTAWADQTGNGNDVDAIGGTDAPQFSASVINGLPGIAFGGPNGTAILGSLTTALVDSLAPRYVVAVLRPTTVGTHNAGQTWGGQFFQFRKSPAPIACGASTE